MSTMRFQSSTLAVILASACMAWAGAPLNDLTGPWVLFVDDYPVETRTRLVRTYHAFEKYAGNPVLQADNPWEGVVYVYGNVLPKEDGTGYRMWYHGLPSDVHNRLMYAESDDGITWTKPQLGIVTCNGSTANNIFIARNGYEHIPSIVHTPWDAADRQYKLINYNGPLGGFIGAYSADGIHFTNESTNPLVTGTGDVGNFVWDFHKDKYAGYVKLGAVVGGMKRRAVGITLSDDWTTWSTPTLILKPDSIDDRWAVGNQKTDFYGLCAFPYESMYVGFLWVLRVTGYIDDCQDGPIFVEMVTSHDGVNWIREEGDRPPILPLGPAGSWDGGMVFTTQHPLVEDGQVKLYYGGITGSHCGGEWVGGVGLATLRKDGFASLDAGSIDGSVTTRKLLGATGTLQVNYAAAAGGYVRVEVQDENGNVIPGYAESDCTPLQGDTLAGTVTWATKTALPSDVSPLRLRFALRNASVYSFRTDSEVAIVPPPSIAQQPLAHRTAIGETTEFSVAADGDSLTYQWQLNGTTIGDDARRSGTGTAVLTIAPVDAQDAGEYRCLVTNDGGTIASETAALQVGTYVFSEIAPSATTSTAGGMSSDGTVVCGTSNNRPFLWSPLDGAVDLGLPVGATTASAVGVTVKTDGTIVVAVDSDAGSNLRAKRWDGSTGGGGAFTSLPRLNGSRDWTVRGLGGNGDSVWFVGSSIGGGNGGGRDACIYQPATNTTVVVPLPTGGHDHSDLYAVSDNGYAAGQFQYGGTTPSGGARTGLLYTAEGATVALYTLAGVPSTLYEAVARTISRDGLVQGGWSYKPGYTQVPRPVIWTNYMTLIELPLLAGDDNDDRGEVHALNGDGSIAAGTSFRDPDGPQEAFIWDAVNGTRKIATVLAERGFDVTRWTFTDATGMSADGTLMCGNGVHNGIAKGWAVSFLDAAPESPRIRVQPTSRVARPTLSASFSVEAVGQGSLTYHWQFNGADLTDSSDYQGVFTPALTILHASIANEGSYRCRVESEYGQAVSFAATLSLVTVRTDFDRDGDVDQADFGFLQACMSGAAITQSDPACAPALLDADDDVDQADLAIFQACRTAPGVLPDFNCD